MLAEQVRQQHQARQHKTDQALEQRGRGQQQEKHRVAPQSCVIRPAPVPPHRRQHATHGEHIRRGHARPEQEIERGGEHPAGNQPGAFAKQALADQVHQPDAQPCGNHRRQTQRPRPQPAHQIGEAGDQPIGGQGLVVIRRAFEVGVEVVTALQHLHGDVRPAGFRAPEVATAQAEQQEQGGNAQQ